MKKMLISILIGIAAVVLVFVLLAGFGVVQGIYNSFYGTGSAAETDSPATFQGAISRCGIPGYTLATLRSLFPYDPHAKIEYYGQAVELPLFAALRHHKLGDFNKFLKEEEDPNGSADLNLLEVAIQQCDLRFASVLLEHGANPNNPNEGESALDKTVLNNDLTAAKLLLNAGADPNLGSGSAIDSAATINAWRMVELLLQHGANPALSSPPISYWLFDNTTLVIGSKSQALAEQAAREEIARLLISKGIQVPGPTEVLTHPQIPAFFTSLLSSSSEFSFKYFQGDESKYTVVVTSNSISYKPKPLDPEVYDPQPPEQQMISWKKVDSMPKSSWDTGQINPHGVPYVISSDLGNTTHSTVVFHLPKTGTYYEFTIAPGTNYGNGLGTYMLSALTQTFSEK